MGLYNFQLRFAEPILSGRKTHTIRAVRAHPDKPGNILYLYIGLRTKNAKLLMTSPCTKVQEIHIYEPSPQEPWRRIHLAAPTVEIDGIGLDRSEIELLARRDGFRDFDEMIAFWNGRLPFHGHIIHWREK